MFGDKKNKWLRKAIKQHKKVFLVFRNRYFYTDETGKYYAQYEKILHFIADQLKLMQEEYDERRGRV